jgi:hypothetical protein
MEGRVPIELDVAELTDLMDEEVPDVYSLPVLGAEFGNLVCDWIDEVSGRVQRRLPTSASLGSRSETISPEPSIVTTIPPGDDEYFVSLSRRPFDLSDVGLDWLVNLLFHVVVRPISVHLFRDDESSEAAAASSSSTLPVVPLSSLDWVQGFVAAYAPDPTPSQPRQHLVAHTDDSEVTLNVCLGRVGFGGGLLSFSGLRGTPRATGAAAQVVTDEYEPQPGRAVLHAGRHFHSVSPVTSGSRYALVLWARSWKGCRSTTCPCCWLNRRLGDQGQPCICGRRWN